MSINSTNSTTPQSEPETAVPVLDDDWFDPTLCCTDRQPGEVSPPHPLSCEANVLRPNKLQHAVQRRDSNGHLGRLPPFGPRAQGVTDLKSVLPSGARVGTVGKFQGQEAPVVLI